MPHANTHVCMCNTLRLATHATYVRLPYIIANNNVLIRYSTPLAVHGADASLSRSSPTRPRLLALRCLAPRLSARAQASCAAVCTLLLARPYRTPHLLALR